MSQQCLTILIIFHLKHICYHLRSQTWSFQLTATFFKSNLLANDITKNQPEQVYLVFCLISWWSVLTKSQTRLLKGYLEINHSNFVSNIVSLKFDY